jgi:small subunit ribosomal protein S17
MSKEITQKNKTDGKTTTSQARHEPSGDSAESSAESDVTLVRQVRRMQLSGTVASDKMKDTIVVTVERYVKHPKYHKFMKKTLRLKAHDAGNTKKIGDKVTIESCRPMSRDKAFKVIS